jgi:hypothetical protein
MERDDPARSRHAARVTPTLMPSRDRRGAIVGVAGTF